MGVFPNDAAVEGLATVLTEINDEWQVERRYFSLESMRRLKEPELALPSGPVQQLMASPQMLRHRSSCGPRAGDTEIAATLAIMVKERRFGKRAGAESDQDAQVLLAGLTMGGERAGAQACLHSLSAWPGFHSRGDVGDDQWRVCRPVAPGRGGSPCSIGGTASVLWSSAAGVGACSAAGRGMACGRTAPVLWSSAAGVGACSTGGMG